MTRADEALRRVHPADRTADVRAAAGDGDVGGPLVVGVGVDFGVELAHVDGRLAGLAEVGGDGQHDRHVIVVGELVDRAHDFPAVGRALEDRPDGEAERGQDERGGGDRAGGVSGAGHEPAPRDRLALEGPRDPPVERVLGLCFACLSATGAKQYRGAVKRVGTGFRRLCASPRSPPSGPRRRAPWLACEARWTPSRRPARRPARPRPRAAGGRRHWPAR